MGDHVSTPPDASLQDHLQLKDRAYQYLKNEIIDLTFRPGERLREARLSEQLGISKTPIREAFVRLQREGLVEIRPYRGAVVTGYDRGDLRELYELREIVEVACARAASERMDSEALARLREVQRASARALAEGEVDSVALLFDEFDELIFAEMPNRRIRAIIDDLRSHLVRIGRMSVFIPGRLQTSVSEHATILDAIETRDVEGTEASMRHHIRSVLADQLKTFGTEGQQ